MRVTYAPASENKLKVDFEKVGAYSRGLELLYRCAGPVSIQTSANALLSTPAYTSTGSQKWAKPAKLKPGEIVEDIWMSGLAKRNDWSAFGGQPRMAKVKAAAHEESDGENDDCEEY